MTYEYAFTALADPTRRAIFERLRTGPQPVGRIADTLPVSRPCVSQHLKILKAAGMVSETTDGTRRLYAIDPRGIAAMRNYLDQFWEDALTRFQHEAETSTPGQSL